MLKSLYEDSRTALSQQELNAVLLAHERFLSYKTGGRCAQLRHARLDGLNLANRNLAEADFAGASLVGANACGSNLERANFYCADLRNCALNSARLGRADLRGASLSGATLAFAMLDAADLRAATMMYSGPGGVTVINRNKVGDKTAGVDFSNCSLKGASFGNAKLDGANFTGALLQGANFKNAKLTNATFKNAVLTGVDLRELSVAPGALDGCVTDVTPEADAKFEELKARLDSHERWIATLGAEGTPAILDGEDLRPLQQLMAGRSLSGLSARNAIAIGLDFSGSELQAAKFEGTDLRDAIFSNADLRGVSLRAARLAHAKFEKANLGHLALTSGVMLAPDLTNAEAVADQFFGALEGSDIASLGLGSTAPQRASA
jgi:uncharacterized protein YjbI with pentapeptide repeats